jgi:hypothetical protein
MDKREELKSQVNKLYVEGISVLAESLKKEAEGKGGDSIQSKYQRWYTNSISVIRQLLPERLQEFNELYKLDKRKDITSLTYTISDYFLGLRITRGVYEEQVVDAPKAFATKFHQQLAILDSVTTRIDSILTDIKGVLKAELYDDEIEKARALHKGNLLRPAGVIAGVVLEAHLLLVCKNHLLTLSKKNSSLADYNDTLKNNNIIDTVNWRWVQRLGDIRNLCAHSKDREPTSDEVLELIDGVEKAIKTIF